MIPDSGQTTEIVCPAACFTKPRQQYPPFLRVLYIAGNCCWAVLPPHALNLRIGKLDPGVLPHVISEESFPLAQFPSMPTNTFVLGQTAFALFAEQPAIELQGVLKQYWSYTVGIANGGSAGLPAFG